MKKPSFNLLRRKLLLWIIGGSIIGPICYPRLIRMVLAMGRMDYPQGMQTVEGDVRINDIQATVGSIVNIGDTVMTGDDSKAVFVMNRSVYLLRNNTNITLSIEQDGSAKENMVSILKLLNGKLLSVFGKGKRRLMTNTAVIGVRGTAVYLESDPKRTYVCTCYGNAEIRSRYDKSVREFIRTHNHEKPRFVYGKGVDEILVKAPVFNHTDKELIMLESLVGRVPPFALGGSGKY
ncbi:MAG: FecR domain-containing protein [Deltaproteobacteria bacterium]|nr:FecR domain-containing protein [Deltaproteobacteria bacterium]